MRNDFGAVEVFVSAATGATPTKIKNTLQARVFIRVSRLLRSARGSHTAAIFCSLANSNL
jgi:hypothetical protein